MTRTRTVAAAAVCVAAAIPLAGCGSSGSHAQSRPAAHQRTVRIAGFRYRPPVLAVATGTTVTWANQDRAPHTVTGRGLKLDDLTTGHRSSFTFRRKGTFTYVCSFHPFMHGEVIVS